MLVAAAVEAAFLVACAREARLAVGGRIAFAVRSDGIFFGSGPEPQVVPWGQISAVELFRERVPRGQSRTSYRCVGVRSASTARSGSPAAGQRRSRCPTGAPPACWRPGGRTSSPAPTGRSAWPTGG